tara:strand:+ start:5859 stop:7013 length:1155 start_codon:yes stop_codon:yes gene_type:complete
MIIYVDIDETICLYEGKREYPLAKPLLKNIEKINQLYEQGHTITYWTARGSQTGLDWRDLTVKQLTEWGAKYHEVKLGKPHYDLYICDKAVNSEDYFVPDQLEVNIFDSMAPEDYREFSEEKIKWIRKAPEFKGVTVFTDKDLLSPWVDNVKSNQKVAWLVECREVHPFAYAHILQVEHKFDYIFTFDDELLARSPKYIKSMIGSTRVSNEDAGIHEKTKLLSLIASKKNWTRGHKLRHMVANSIKDRYEVDLWGEAYRPWGNPSVSTGAAVREGKAGPLKDYYFSIAIMNSKLNNYFTETLVDLFRYGTVPIFWGCDNIGEYFNLDGMMTFNNGPELFEILDQLSPEEYFKREAAIKENFELAKNYRSMNDTFADSLKKVLNK